MLAKQFLVHKLLEILFIYTVKNFILSDSDETVVVFVVFDLLFVEGEVWLAWLIRWYFLQMNKLLFKFINLYFDLLIWSTWLCKATIIKSVRPTVEFEDFYVFLSAFYLAVFFII